MSVIYETCRHNATEQGVTLPSFEQFWQDGRIDLSSHDAPVIMLEDFRRDPIRYPLQTPSGRIELFSERIASFAYDECAGHPTWYEPVEWLGADRAATYPLHLISDQPNRRLHSQWDPSPHAASEKIKGREPITIHPTDAEARGIAAGDLVRVFNDRGACLAGARLSDAIRPGVVRLSTGAWFDPIGTLDKHGNPNTLTRDQGTSRLSQGCSAQSCLVDIARHQGEVPPLTAHATPRFVSAETSRGDDHD
ncbi:MAG: molybdopterin dinucleotide binding domain-containing protein [Pseudomonadota bacterium]